MNKNNKSRFFTSSRKIKLPTWFFLLFFSITQLVFTSSAFADSAFPFFVHSLKQHLVDFVNYSVSTIKYSAYKLGGTHIDTHRGIYVVDCSGYVDYSLQKVCPNSYTSLVNSARCDKPNSLQYYDFFQHLSYNPKKYWNKVDEIEELQPGDILVFRYKRSRRPGHVMIVMNKPVQYGDVYMVTIADSAPCGHSQDTRQPHKSGVGIGTLLLKADPRTGQPSAYAWQVGSYWVKNVNFAMARPNDNGMKNFQNDQTQSDTHWEFTPGSAGYQKMNPYYHNYS